MIRSLAVVLLLGTAVPAISSDLPEPFRDWRVGGELVQARGKLALYIDGEQVFRDWIQFPTVRAGFDEERETTRRPAEFKAKYRGHDIYVNCAPLPISADLACTVDADGHRVKALTFFEERAGDAQAFPGASR